MGKASEATRSTRPSSCSCTRGTEQSRPRVIEQGKTESLFLVVSGDSSPRTGAALVAASCVDENGSGRRRPPRRPQAPPRVAAGEAARLRRERRPRGDPRAPILEGARVGARRRAPAAEPDAAVARAADEAARRQQDAEAAGGGAQDGEPDGARRLAEGDDGREGEGDPGSAVLAGWDFTSSDAITQEYVENVASCVSLL